MGEHASLLEMIGERHLNHRSDRKQQNVYLHKFRNTLAIIRNQSLDVK